MSNVEEIKSRADIVDVVGKVVKLKKAGINYKGLCPFHNEKTPSFFVSEQRQSFTCFGCGASGDVLEFVQRYYGLDFMEAMEQLAEQYGVTLERNYGGGEKLDRFYEMNREAASYFFKNLRKGPNPGLNYAAKRQLTKETLHDFGIGYAGEDWTDLYDHMKSKGYEDKDLLRMGLVSQSGKRIYDKFRDRLIFPIWNVRGKVIGFGGRILGDGEPKYLNSQETPVFQKKNNLYGLYQGKSEIAKQDLAILVEGYIDVVSLHQAGVKNAVASLGTALTENQAQLLKRYTKNVVLCYDSDNAGIQAALRGMDVLKSQEMNVRVMHVTDGKDPDDFIKEKGRDAFLELVDKALPYGEYRFRYLASKHDLTDLQGRVDFLKEAVSVLKRMSPVEADVYISQLSQTYDISPDAIRLEMGRDPNSAVRERPALTREKADLSPAERSLVKLALTDASFMDRPEFPEGFTTAEGRELLALMRQGRREGAPLDPADLDDLLTDSQRMLVGEVQRTVLLPGDAEGVFRDCIRTVRKNALKEKEKTLLWQIQLAEEQQNMDMVTKLTKELMEVQKKIQGGGTAND